MESVKNGMLSSTKSIFVLYLIISANFLPNLFGCKAQDAFINEMWLKHLLGFMTLYFFVVLVDQPSEWTSNPTSQFIFSIFCYLLFIVSTRMDYKWWIIFILSLCIIYILQVYKEHVSTPEKEKQTYQKYQQYITYFSSIILLLGFLVYLGKKKMEYKKKFDWLTFLLGKTNCAFTKDRIGVDDYTNILNAFK